MTYASPRPAAVAAALVLALSAASPVAASPTYLTLDRPANQIAANLAPDEIPVTKFFWSPAGPPPAWNGIKSYLIVPGAAWAAGSPVENGALGALVRKGSCHALAQYQGARLRIGDHIHTLRDVVVTACQPLPAADGDVEWMALAFVEAE